MSMSNEYRLAESLVWSDKDFSLAEFVQAYELPQVVLVEIGYCGVDERTTFSSGQILTLHCVRTTSKIVCEVPHAKAVLVPASCELKAEVIPMECDDTVVTARKLSTIYQKIKYVRVMELGSTWNNNTVHTLKINDILQIKKIEQSNSLIKCKNLTTSEMVAISLDSTAAFIPLADPEKYTLAEIKNRFGLPAKVRFLDRKAEIKQRAVGLPDNRKFSTLLSDLGQITAIEEINDSDVIVTTVCSNLDEKQCFNVPTNLDIRITVAEGFLSGDQTYQKVVRTLDKEFNRTDLKKFEDLDVYSHIDAVKKTMENPHSRLLVEDASPEVVVHAHQSLDKQRASDRKESKNPFSFEKKPPKPPPRRSESFKKEPITPPTRPSKPKPKLLSKPAPKQEQKRNIQVLGKKLKSMTLPLKSPRFNLPGQKQHHTKSSSTAEEHQRELHYEQPLEKTEVFYASVDDIYERADESNSDSEYTELDASYKPINPHSYQKLFENPPKVNPPPLPTSSPPSQMKNVPPSHPTSSPPPLPTTGPPKSPQDKQAIYETIAKFPQDLTGLSIADVGRLLKYLGMGNYVQTFESELIDGSMLATMDQESLESLDMTVFHVKKLLRFIDGWRPNV